MKKLSILFLIAILSACSVKLAPVTQPDVERADKIHPGATMTYLNEGKSNFQHFCTQCHGLKDPKSRTQEQWQQLVPKMAERAARSEKKEKIEGDVRESILTYLRTMAKKG